MIQQIVAHLGAIVYGTMAFFQLIYIVITGGIGVFKSKDRLIPPKILSDKSFGTHKYMTLKKQNLRLHYAELGNPSNPLVVCLHGFPECWYSWRHQMKALSEEFCVIAVDMRGFGDSDKPPNKKDYNMDYIVEDIREFISGLGRKKCFLMAHDWGGPIGWQLVTRYPEMFSGHISINGPEPFIFFGSIGKNFEQTRMSWYIYMFQTPWLPEILLSIKDLEYINVLKKRCNVDDPDEIELLKYYYSKKGGFTYPLNYYRNIFSYEFRESKESVVPTLILWGDEDHALSKNLPEKMAAICKDATVHHIKGAGHFLHQETPSVVNAHIQNFLKKLRHK